MDNSVEIRKTFKKRIFKDIVARNKEIPFVRKIFYNISYCNRKKNDIVSLSKSNKNHLFTIIKKNPYQNFIVIILI